MSFLLALAAANEPADLLAEVDPSRESAREAAEALAVDASACCRVGVLSVSPAGGGGVSGALSRPPGIGD